MKHFIIITLVTLVFASCGQTYEYWDISKFKMDTDALADDEEVIILYSSRAPNNNMDKEYYIQMVVVSQKTGDTVNVLTTFNHDLTMEDKGKVFNFFNEDNIATKVLQMDIKDLEGVKNIDDIKSEPSKKITKVARDPKFDFIADNNYPTIIGVIGVASDDKK